LGLPHCVTYPCILTNCGIQNMDDLDGPPIQEHSLAGQKRKRPDQAVPPGGAKLVGIQKLIAGRL